MDSRCELDLDTQISKRPTVSCLGARVHLFARPESREHFVNLFKDVLGCKVMERDFGLSHPIVFVGFHDGSGFSVEFSDLAPEESGAKDFSDEDALRGAWIEFRSPNAAAVRQLLREARVREFRHPGSAHPYFSAPGGQVFRVLDSDYVGP